MDRQSVLAETLGQNLQHPTGLFLTGEPHDEIVRVADEEGSRWNLFPCFNGTMRCSDSLPPVSPCFVYRLAIPTDASVFVSPIRSGADLRAWSFTLATPQSHFTTGNDRSPRFLENPFVPTPCSPTPAGPGAAGQYAASTWPPFTERRRLPQEVISGLNHTALTLAVYASSGGLPAQDARLASGCWPSSAGRD